MDLPGQAVRFLLIAGLLLGSGLLMAGCAEDPPLKIGFVGGLTGRVAGLGVAGRDGAQLAVDEQNRQGGVAGRQLALVVRDDKQDAAVAEQVVTELIDEEVVAIVGHMTSSMSVVTQPIIERAGIVMISPTSKTDLLSAQEDHFFRVTPQLSINAAKLAEYVVTRRGLKRFAILYNSNNRAFSEPWLQSFTQNLQSHAGEVIVAIPFQADSDLSFLELVQQVLAADPEGLLILANAMDTALIAQQTRKVGSTIPLFTSEWSFTSDVINFGGSAVEGITSFHTFDAASEDPHYLAFRDSFVQRYGYQPSFATVLSYDAIRCLISALEKNPRRAGLKQALLQIDGFHGLQSDFHFDQNGDVQRPLFLTTVRDGHFRVDKQQ